MVDPEAVRRRLRELDRRVSRLRAIHGAGREAFLADEGLQAQAERHLQLAAQAAIDIANHIVAEDSPETPEDCASTFTLLAGIGSSRRTWRADFGSLPASETSWCMHTSTWIPPLVWDSVGRISDLDEFAAAVESYLGS